MRQWPHSPSRLVKGPGTYFVTASTYKKVLLYDAPEKLNILTDLLFEVAEQEQWKLQAWAVFGNHYHFIGNSGEKAGGPSRLISKLHTLSASALNKVDQTPGRKVWFQFRDTALTFERSYYARLGYVHNNPVKHGLVRKAAEYPWCSAGWFERTADPVLYETVKSFKYDRLEIDDDF